MNWNNLQHRGWMGPGRCQLCKGDIEDIDHLLYIVPSLNLYG